MKFKVGDKILAKSFGEGKIINIDNTFSYPILVEFFKEIDGGHDGNNYGEIVGKREHCWWFKEQQLKFTDFRHIKVYGIVDFCKKYYK